MRSLRHFLAPSNRLSPSLSCRHTSLVEYLGCAVQPSRYHDDVENRSIYCSVPTVYVPTDFLLRGHGRCSGTFPTDFLQLLTLGIIGIFPSLPTLLACKSWTSLNSWTTTLLAAAFFEHATRLAFVDQHNRAVNRRKQVDLLKSMATIFEKEVVDQRKRGQNQRSARRKTSFGRERRT